MYRETGLDAFGEEQSTGCAEFQRATAFRSIGTLDRDQPPLLALRVTDLVAVRREEHAMHSRDRTVVICHGGHKRAVQRIVGKLPWPVVSRAHNAACRGQVVLCRGAVELPGARPDAPGAFDPL